MPTLSPSKPHFFKPIRPGFLNGIEIPESFSRFSGTGKAFSGESRLTTMGGREWRVEIEAGFLTNGWMTFARDNKLKLNDFVVFQLIGRMKFKVYVFDGISKCGSVPHGQQGADNIVPVPTSVKVKKLDGGISDDSPASFTVGIMSSHLKYKALDVPRSFVPRFSKKGHVLLRDEDQKDWLVKLTLCKAKRRMRMVGGWPSFKMAKKLKEGDHLKFDLIENGEVPILRVTFDDV